MKRCSTREIQIKATMLYHLIPLKMLLSLSTINCHLPFTSTRIKSCAPVATDLQDPLKGVQGGEQKWSTLCSGEKTAKIGLQMVRHFQEPILWAQFLYLLNCDLLTSGKLHENSRNFLKNYVLDCRSSPFTKITYILTFLLASLEQFLRALWGAVSWAAVFTLPQTKFNLQISCCAIVLSWHQKEKR